jgi:Tol biopolymer transport system component
VAFDWKANDPQTQFRHIFSKEVRGEARRQLSDGAGEYNAAWSPDGSRIAFIRGGQGVFVTSQLGGADQRISETGTHVGWTADSKSLLIRDKPTEAGQPNPPFGIYQISLDTRVKRQITQGAKGVGDWVFSVSPDGKNLAFARYGLPGVGDVYVVPMSGGEPRRLTNWAGSGISVAWTPDGREIVYTVTEPQGGRIWRIPWNTSKPGRGRPLANQTGDANFVSISRPAGNRPARLAYQVEYIDTDLSLVDLAAVSDGKFTSFQPLAESTRVETKARFSPDATKVAFASNRSGIKEIWVCNRDGSDVTQLTSLGGSDTLPGYWSPDGRMLLLQATVEGNSDVYVVPSNGGKPKRLTHDSSLHMAPSWSRDGKWIYFSAVPLSGESHRPQIWKMPAEGGNAIQLTRDGGFFQQESFDGKFLYFLDRPQDSASDLGNLMRIPVNGGDAVKVLGGIRGDLWSLTRKGVFFVTKDNNQDAIRLFQFEDGKEMVAGILTFRISTYGGGMSVSEDGRWLLTNQTKRRDTDLMLIENFR